MLEILGNIGFDWRVAFANFANFLIIFYLLKRFAFGPLQRLLDERKKKVDEGLENARQAETELMMARQSRETSLSDAKAEVNDLLAHARVQEESIIAKAAEQAENEARHILKAAEERTKHERDQMEREVHARTTDLVLQGVEKILKESIDQEKGERIVKEILAGS